MRIWISSAQSNFVVVGVVYACSFLFAGDNAITLPPPAISDKPAHVEPAQPSLLVSDGLEQSLRFQDLRAQWLDERSITSSIHEMCTTPAYLKIIAMGREAAVPLLIGQLRSEGEDPDHWFFALHCLTGADPVLPESRGRMKQMAKAWIDWADQQVNG